MNVVNGDVLVNDYPLVPVGTIVPYINNTAPNGWLICDGSEVEIIRYRRLYDIILNRFGNSSNPNVYFSLPDLRGRVPIGNGTDGTLTNRSIGTKGGSETHTLTVSELPAHSHTGTTDSAGNHTHVLNIGAGDDSNNSAINGQPPTADGNNVTNSYNTNAAGVHTHTFTTNSTGSGDAHNNMQPFIVLNYIIRY